MKDDTCLLDANMHFKDCHEKSYVMYLISPCIKTYRVIAAAYAVFNCAARLCSITGARDSLYY